MLITFIVHSAPNANAAAAWHRANTHGHAVKNAAASPAALKGKWSSSGLRGSRGGSEGEAVGLEALLDEVRGDDGHLEAGGAGLG